MKESAKCDACLEEMRINSVETHNEIVAKATETLQSIKMESKLLLGELDVRVDNRIAQMDDKVTAFLAAQEEKMDIKIDKLMSFAKWLFGTVVVVLISFGGVLGYITLEVSSKANKTEALSIKDAKIIRELGDKYYDARYVLRDSAYVDPTNYQMLVETLFERASRGTLN